VERQGRGWRGGGMDRDLQLALDPVLTDLVSAGVAPPCVTREDWAHDSSVSAAMAWWAGGSGDGVYITHAATDAERIVELADRIQVGAVEELCRLGRPAVWPHLSVEKGRGRRDPI
jgi:hypothetical protein